MSDYIMHIGTPHEGWIPHSGRYKYGSGEHAYQRAVDFLGSVAKYRNEGKTDKEIAGILGCLDRFHKPSAGELKRRERLEKLEKEAWQTAQVKKLRDENNMTWQQIADKLELKNESVARSWYSRSENNKAKLVEDTIDILKTYVDKYKYVDVGPGTNLYMGGITEGRLKDAVEQLKLMGYQEQLLQIPQMGTNYKTTLTVLTRPDVTYSDLSENRDQIRFPGQDMKVFDSDGKLSRLGDGGEVVSVDSKRILIRYAEEGGSDRDGSIELRPGVNDISLGGHSYAQVRIGVDDKYYLKGMAIYNDNMPPGIDIVFNTSKHLGTPMGDVFKKMKTVNGTDEINWDNPFGANYTGFTYKDKDGIEKTSCIKIVRHEGEWLGWDNNISSQFGSKQPKDLIKRQLDLQVASKAHELEEIMALTNPTVKKKLLISFADKCDALASELKAAPFVGQQTHVLLPCPELKDNEIYAPNYPDGTRVVLVRHPYAGPFESPELTVRNTGSPAQKIIPLTAPDAVCLNKKNLDKMSGADCDGDAAIVIPQSERTRVLTAPSLPGLKTFDPHEEYHGYAGMNHLSKKDTQMEMGKVTNLITDMSIKGAPMIDIEKAVKHSMVIIDADKHNLDWKRSEKENDILHLKKIYQDNGDGKTGASTLISRAGAEINVPIAKDWRPSATTIDIQGRKILQYPKEAESTYMVGKLKGGTVHEDKTGNLYFNKVDEDTGKRVRVPVDIDIFKEGDYAINRGGKIVKAEKKSGEVIVNKAKDGSLYYLENDISTGKSVRVPVSESDFKNDIQVKGRTTKTARMNTVDDAYELTSAGGRENLKYPVEKIYAEFANSMKANANAARKAWLETGNLEYDKEAAKKYATEVAGLQKQLNNAIAYSPLERQAQLMAGHNMKIAKANNPGMTKEEEKKYKGQAIIVARNKLTGGNSKPKINISESQWEAIQAGAISETKLRQILDYSDIDILRERATPHNRKTMSPATETFIKSLKNQGLSNAQIADRIGFSTSAVSSVLSGKKGG